MSAQDAVDRLVDEALEAFDLLAVALAVGVLVGPRELPAGGREAS